MLDPRELLRTTILRRLEHASFDRLSLVANLLHDEGATASLRVRASSPSPVRRGRPARPAVALPDLIPKIVAYVADGNDGQGIRKIARGMGLAHRLARVGLDEAVKTGAIATKGHGARARYYPT